VPSFPSKVRKKSYLAGGKKSFKGPEWGLFPYFEEEGVMRSDLRHIGLRRTEKKDTTNVGK